LLVSLYIIIMNYTPLEEAYKIQHVSNNTYNKIYNNKEINYDKKCIFCSFPNTIPLMGDRDNGIFRGCLKCKKEFVAKIISMPINNYNYSTQHLKGTN
jgi:hypothetical protein